MIRYPVSRTDLEAEIEIEQPGWLKRARARTKKFVAARKYSETTNIWSEIKAVYMRRQHNKCAYCERQLTSPDHGGAIEHHLEHYRPKNEVPAWPPAGSEGDSTFPFSTGLVYPSGYYWLAYEPFNYATSCKKCNSPLKRNFFPIAGIRGAATAAPQRSPPKNHFLCIRLATATRIPKNC